MFGKEDLHFRIAIPEESDKCGQDTTRNRGHPTSHQTHQLRSGHVLDVGTNQQRGFCLTEKYIAHCRKTFRAAQTQCLAHDPGEDLDNAL